MSQSKNTTVTSFILLEILLGVTGAVLYLNFGPDGNGSLFASIFDLIIWINLIFFAATILPGIINAVLLGKNNRIFISIVCSLLAGLATLVLIAFLKFPGPFMFLSLAGFILGFYIALLKKQRTSVSQSR